METLSQPPPAIAFAERLYDGVVVTFTDGKCALYPAHFLYDSILQARDLTDLPADDA